MFLFFRNYSYVPIHLLTCARFLPFYQIDFVMCVKCWHVLMTIIKVLLFVHYSRPSLWVVIVLVIGVSTKNKNYTVLCYCIRPTLRKEIALLFQGYQIKRKVYITVQSDVKYNDYINNIFKKRKTLCTNFIYT